MEIKPLLPQPQLVLLAVARSTNASPGCSCATCQSRGRTYPSDGRPFSSRTSLSSDRIPAIVGVDAEVPPQIPATGHSNILQRDVSSVSDDLNRGWSPCFKLVSETEQVLGSQRPLKHSGTPSMNADTSG